MMARRKTRYVENILKPISSSITSQMASVVRTINAKVLTQKKITMGLCFFA